jgi:hypothetical protein
MQTRSILNEHTRTVRQVRSLNGIQVGIPVVNRNIRFNELQQMDRPAR